MTSEQEQKYRDTLAKASNRLKELLAQLNDLKGTGRIAVVGIGCRFPGGADSPEKFWELLEKGIDTVGDIPADRWSVAAWYDPDPSAPGKSYTKRGAFLKREELEQFDASFFGISPPEADALDPQQRLLLETTWEALERSGTDPDSVRGTRTGVFVGVGGPDYAQGGLLSGNTACINPYSITGVQPSVAAGRISYLLDLNGPNLSLDTACSSSLVAILLAMKSLLTHECDAALAGGVSLMLTPAVFVALSRMNALSADGVVRAFGDHANGYVRGEGCGILYLKRLEDAERAGDPVIAVLRGGAINHDGQSNGLTAPNALSQQEVIRSALNLSGMTADEIDAIEAHGTGTPLGDPIEARSLAEVFGARKELPVGSVKTNIGHLEVAAGVAGAIKAVLMVNRCMLPPSLHAQQLNKHIPWDDIPVRVVRELRPFAATGRLRAVGVSSFGFSGTNAHLIVQEYRRHDGSVFPLSARMPAPFRRKLHWVDPMAAYSAPRGSHAATPPEGEITPSAEAILAALTGMVTTVSGMDAAALDFDVNLFELGLDSLMLIQLRDTVNRDYGVTLELSSLMEEADTLRRLAMFVAARVAKVPSSAVRSMPATTLPAMAGTGDAAMERFFGHQLAEIRVLMQRQLDALRQGGGLLPDERRKINFRAMILDDESGRLTEAQQGFVTSVIARHTERTPRSKELAQQHRRHLSDWINTLAYRGCLKELVYPIASSSSSGAWFTDIDGNRYLDLAMGFGVAFFGHAPPFVTQAVQERLSRGIELATQLPEAGETAEIFCRLTGMERVTFCNTGSEAVMIALRIARTVTARDRIVIFAGSYHGIADGVLAFADDNGQVMPTSSGVTFGSIGSVTVLPYGTEESLSAIRAQAGELAAILVEPVQSRRPGFQPVEFLRELRTIADQSGSALIFDEMITGFRSHPGGAQAVFGIKADLATYGKAVGGGMPISMVAGKAHFMDAVDGGYWDYGDQSRPEAEVMFFGGTFCRHPLAIAASLATLRHIEQQGPALQEGVNRKTDRLASELNSFFIQERVPMLMQHFGSLFRLESYGQYALLLQPLEMDLFFYLLMSRGIFTWERRICFLSAAHTDEDVDLIITAVKESIRELRAGGFVFEGVPPELSLPSFPAFGGQGSRVAGSGQAGTALQADPAIASCRSTVGANGTQIFPMSSAQRRLYILSQLEEGEGPYHLSGATLVEGPLDLARLRSAFNQLVLRHESLRTGFDMQEGELVQVVQSDAPIVVTELEVSEDQAPQAIERFISPFDLAQPPLLRILALKTAGERHIIVLDSHHIALDGFSLNILISEFVRLYSGKELTATPLQYRDYVRMQQAYLESRQARLDEQFWHEQLAGQIPEPPLPSDFSRPAWRQFDGDTVRVRYGEELTTALKQAAAKSGTTLFMFLLAGFATLLHRLSGQSGLIIGVPVSSRDSSTMNSIGMFANTLPLRVAMDPGARFDTFLKKLTRETFTAFEHQHYPFELIVDRLNLPVDTSRNPLFDVCFSFENADDRVMKIEKITASPYDVPRTVSMFDLALEAIEEQGTLWISFEFASSLFRRETVERWERNYRSILEEVIKTPSQRLGELDAGDVDRLDRISVQTAAPRPTPSELQAFLANYLPAHMIPSSFHVLDRIPLTSNGKIDRKALLSNKPVSPARDDRDAVGRTELEKKIALIWEEVLGQRDFGMHDSFFSVGGHSLKAVRAISRIQRELALDLKLKDFFTAPTIAGLAELAESRGRHVFPDIERLGNRPSYPLSHAQKRLWLLDQAEPEAAAAYNMTGSWLIEGALDKAALKRAFGQVAARHEVLRTCFGIDKGEPCQMIAERVVIPWVEEDLRHTPQALARAKELVREEGTTPLVLGAVPLLRIMLLQLPEEQDRSGRHLLVVTLHHIIGDGWSVGILMDEISRLYGGESPENLMPLPVQYRDYAAWHNRLVSGPSGEKMRSYWLEALSGEIAPLELPTDFPRPERPSGKGDSIPVALGHDLARSIRKLAAEQGTTLFSLLLAVIKVLLYARSGQDDLVVCVPVAGREHPDLEQQIGLYLNTLPLRNRLHPDATFLEFLVQVRQTVEAGFSHQEFPFDLMVEELGVTRQQGRGPLLDVLFVLQNNEPARFALHGTQVTPFFEGALMSKFDLMFDLVDNEVISGNIEYSSDLYRPETATRYAEDLKVLMSAVMSEPTMTIAGLERLLAPVGDHAALQAYQQATAVLSEDF